MVSEGTHTHTQRQEIPGTKTINKGMESERTKQFQGMISDMTEDTV